MLRDTGTGGTAVFWFFIDEQGRVRRTQLQRSSGYPALDRVAEQVASIMQFSPAYNRDQAVPVWIELPITFTPRPADPSPGAQSSATSSGAGGQSAVPAPASSVSEQLAVRQGVIEVPVSALAQQAPGPQAASTARGRITGMITDATTGQPLSGVQVYLEGTGLGTLTQANGRYFMLNVPAGTHTVVIQHDSYAPLRRTNVVVAGDVARTLDVQLTLNAARSGPTPTAAEPGRLAGIVTDENGNPVAGARVYLAVADLEVVTGSDGRYTMVGVPTGVHTVTVRHPTSGQTVTRTGISVVDDITSNADFIIRGTPAAPSANPQGPPAMRVEVQIREFQDVREIPAHLADMARQPTFTPMTIRPELQNRDEIQRAIRNEYPAMLRDAGVGGTTVFWFLIDESGRVLRTAPQRSTGYPALDEAAQSVARLMQFSPAYNRDQVVPVWIELPISFSSR
jgi:TonB family protein